MKTSIKEIENMLVRTYSARLTKELLAQRDLGLFEYKRPSLLLRFLNRWRSRIRRVRGAWDVLRGRAYASYD
jgi:hypothetical protein